MYRLSYSVQVVLVYRWSFSVQVVLVYRWSLCTGGPRLYKYILYMVLHVHGGLCLHRSDFYKTIHHSPDFNIILWTHIIIISFVCPYISACMDVSGGS